jgi:hypothetical protein
MAIVFNCPHCNEQYRLKDEFAGRKATCKNPNCRQLIVIPIPPSAAELEAAAMSALASVAQTSDQEGPVVEKEKVIPVTCNFCGHNWTEPMAKAGKNTLCPECKQRIRVPEPKQDTPDDWRQQKTKLPSMAKGAHEKLEGVEDAGQAKIVSGEALREAGATGEEIEPRSMKQWAVIIFSALALLSLIAFGIWYLFSSRSENLDHQIMVKGQKEFEDASKELSAIEKGLYAALFHAMEAEYQLRLNDEKRLAEAHDILTKKALPECRSASDKSPVRSLVAAELASLVIRFGGTNEEVKAQTRYDWRPGSGGGVLGNARAPSIHALLVTHLGLFNQADFDLKIGVARRLTRELAKKGQSEFASDILPLALFIEPQRDEARAVIALEIKRIDPGSDVPAKVAAQLKTRIESEIKAGKNKTVNWSPYPASAQTLCGEVGIDFRPLSTPTGNPNPNERIAFTGKYLLAGDFEQAISLATRGQPVDSLHKLNALVLCAEWMPNPARALDAALVVHGTRGKQTLSQYQVLRLAQIGFATGNNQQAKQLADTLTDDGMKAWAFGDSVRQRILAAPKEKAEEEWFEVPVTSDKLRVGHAWGRFWMARHNTGLSGDRDAEQKAVAGWSPAPVRAFGYAGIALGLQDR